MADRIQPETGITRVRTVTEQRWRKSSEPVERKRESTRRRPRKPRPDSSDTPGGIDEFA